MIRTSAQYLQNYDLIAARFLGKADTYTEGVQKGLYIENGGLISLLFAYCQAAIAYDITTEATPNDVLDKIIVSV